MNNWKLFLCHVLSYVAGAERTQSEVIIRLNVSGPVSSALSSGHRAPALSLTAFTQYCARALP